ncbi:anaphase-promoting complex subunit 8 [Diplocarpon mali]|nr:anaphase-promoting complex subunit 8 [Diplocarpon mali]
MALNERETSQLRAALQEAVVKCSERCLYQSAKWAAELLTSIPTIDTSESEDSQMTEVPLEGLPPIAVTGNLDPEEAQFEAREINQYLLAKALFDCREFDRCAAVFLPDTVLSGILSVASTKHPNASKPKAKGKGKAPSARTSAAAQMSIPKLSQKSLFLALYAKFMSGEKKKDEDSEMVMGPHDGGTAVNKQLVVISRFLEGWFRERGTNENGRINGSQGWLEYLYGMVLAKDKNEDEAMPYHTKDFVAADAHFSNLLALHPHRLDSLDHYSNILYVMNLRPKLSFLAHLCSTVDKFRPESCVVIGNYYSLLSSHEKAVQYFRRALTLDRSCLSAWTLMGHEYVELKNTHAAIESYRRAVDVNRRDYRAWYGLGQTYEVLEMHAYALWYYKRAAGLRPWDGKMWMAVGTCLQKMGRDLEGIKALKRALLADSYYDAGVGSSFGSGARERGTAMDPDILLQIAGMYEKIEDEAEARAYMEMCVAQEEGVADNLEASVINIHADSQSSDDESRPAPGAGGGGSGGDSGTGVTAATSKARMWLAKHAMKAGDFQRAMQLATELCQDGVEVEEAKALVREVRVRLEANEDS